MATEEIQALRAELIRNAQQISPCIVGIPVNSVTTATRLCEIIKDEFGWVGLDHSMDGDGVMRQWFDIKVFFPYKSKM